jgi:thiol-disulfide isomerase/thioredoxin
LSRGEEYGLVWSLFPMDEANVAEVVENSREMMTEVNGKLSSMGLVYNTSTPEANNTEEAADDEKSVEKAKKFSITWTNTHEFSQVIENMFGLQITKPTIVYQTKAGDKKYFVLTEEENNKFTSEFIAEYIKKCESNEVSAYLKSEEIPEHDPSHELVQPVVGKNLKELVFTEDKDVFIQVGAPWCGHCQKMKPEMNKLGRKLKKDKFDNIMTIAYMDGSKNDSPVDSLSWTGFPTMFYVKAKTGEFVVFFFGQNKVFFVTGFCLVNNGWFCNLKSKHVFNNLRKFMSVGPCDGEFFGFFNTFFVVRSFFSIISFWRASIIN